MGFFYSIKYSLTTTFYKVSDGMETERDNGQAIGFSEKKKKNVG